MTEPYEGTEDYFGYPVYKDDEVFGFMEKAVGGGTADYRPLQWGRRCGSNDKRLRQGHSKKKKVGMHTSSGDDPRAACP